MADDIVTHLANLATDHGSYRTHYEGCHLYHLECAALIVCDEIERLRAEDVALRNNIDALTNMLSEQCDMSDRYALAANKAEDEIKRLQAEVERLRSWIDRQEPRKVYEATICPICHKATESRFMQPVEDHAVGCPWQEARRG